MNNNNEDSSDGSLTTSRVITDLFDAIECLDFVGVYHALIGGATANSINPNTGKTALEEAKNIKITHINNRPLIYHHPNYFIDDAEKVLRNYLVKLIEKHGM